MQIKNFQHRQECRWQGQVKINFYNQHYATNAVSELNPVYSFYSLTHAAFFSILHIFHLTFFLSCLSIFLFLSLCMVGFVLSLMWWCRSGVRTLALTHPCPLFFSLLPKEKEALWDSVNAQIHLSGPEPIIFILRAHMKFFLQLIQCYFGITHNINHRKV